MRLVHKTFVGVWFIIGVLSLTFVVYQLNTSSSLVTVEDDGSTTIADHDLEEVITAIPKLELSVAEIDGLLFMREEEKLARDVYFTLYLKWDVKIFNNIQDSEETHMGAVKLLLDKYEITDSATSEIGNFSNPVLQTLYDDLVDRGNQSVIEALKVGAVIEEIDILDLEDYLENTDKEDLMIVYELLLLGSRNHLRSFVSNLSKNSVSYTPEYLTLTDYKIIIDNNIEEEIAGTSTELDLPILLLSLISFTISILSYLSIRMKNNSATI